MIISPDYRRKGIAGLLIQTMLEHARKHKLEVIRLGTSEHQTAARAMYQKYGWREASRARLTGAYGLVVVPFIEYKLDLVY
jgi:ribosomal protein S18 acetylase RimI-like enzyme